ncbi:MAG: hypothetical protein HRS57_03705 [Mycoplasmataceae bacterium]|nr:hypothetical protein [Mycoplasmataceae bacterium]
MKGFLGFSEDIHSIVQDFLENFYKPENDLSNANLALDTLNKTLNNYIKDISNSENGLIEIVRERNKKRFEEIIEDSVMKSLKKHFKVD